jgi:molybdate transport system substrate-binding protein
MRIRSLATTVVGLTVMLPLATATRAAEIKVLASNGVQATLEALAPEFERATGHKLKLEFGLAAVLKRRIEGGEAFDVAVLTKAGIDDLATQGKVLGASRRDIARSGVGIGIRAGTPRPDISTTEALKRTLLAAKSVSWAKEGASRVYFASVLQRIGIADQVKQKAVLASSGAEVGTLLVNGKAGLGVLLVNELMTMRGVEVLGPLPPELQSYTVFTTGASAARQGEAAAPNQLIEFLSSAAAQAMFKLKGQEPL